MAPRLSRVRPLALGATVVALTLTTLAASQAPKPKPQDPATQKPAGQSGQAAPAPDGQAQGDQAQPAQPTFRANINLVRVDVIVTDKKGAPVDTLKQADFQVFEDGKPQDIETFKLFKIDAITSTTPARPIRTSFDEESEAQRDDVRLFAFFLDDYHVRRGNAMFARGKMAAFVRDQVAPQDMVSIMYPLQPTDTVVMSRDHENLAKALEQFDGVKYNYTPRNQFEDQYANYPATVVEQIRNDVSISAIKGLIIKLGGLREGRKALVLVSEGYTDYLPPQMRRQNAMMGGTEVSSNPFAGDGMAAEKERFFSQAEMLGRLRDIYELANRNNVSIYALDPRGLAAFDSDIDEGAGGISLTTDRDMLRLTMDSIRVLADNTDGRAIVNSNDLLAGLKQIVRDQSAYYLLGYNSARSLGDGKFHEIKVKVNRPGVEVRARKGYVAFSQEDLKNAMAPPKPDRPKDVDFALASITSQRRGEYIRSWMGMSRGNNGKTKITYVWEPAAAVGERREQADRVAVTVIGTDGAPFYRGRSPSQPASFSTGMVQVDGAAPAPPTATGLRSAHVVSFEVPPGRVQMKVAIEDASSFTLDTDAREFMVPDLSAPEVSLSTPAVFRARTQPEADALSKNPDAVPTIVREFRRTERLVVRFQAYGPGTEIPDVAVRVLNRIGDPIENLPVPSPLTTTTVNVQLPLSNLAPGEYLIELRALGQGGAAKQLIGFRVTS